MIQKLVDKNSDKIDLFDIRILSNQLKSNNIDINKNNKYIIIQSKDFSVLGVMMCVPENTLYLNGKFKLEVKFDKNFLYKVPTINFVTKIYRTYVKGDNDDLCCYAIQILSPKSWSTHPNIIRVLESVYSLLQKPILDSFKKCNLYSNECKELILKEPDKYKEITTKGTKEYAFNYSN